MFKNRLFKLKQKLNNIKLLAMDFDGILTDGGVFLSNDNFSMRKFNTKDGMGIKLLQKIEITIAIISGSNSNIINKRAENLGINIIEKSINNKAKSLIEIQNKFNFKPEETLFLGDDVNDLNVLPHVNLFFTPNDAHLSCKRKASFISKYNGGNGFIRDISDKILLAKGIDPYLPFESRNEYSD